MRVLVAAISLLLTLFSATSHAWLNEDWSARKKITLTNKAGEVADAPVLIRLHTGNFDFLSANENGSDLRVVAGYDTTELKFHLESCVNHGFQRFALSFNRTAVVENRLILNPDSTSPRLILK